MPRPRFATILPVLVAGLLTLAACDAPVVETRPADQVGIERALFLSYPAEVYDGLAQACSKPGDILTRPTRGRLQCEGLPDPQTAASLIIGFDGKIDDLPRFVMTLTGQQGPGGYLVTFDYHIRVPQAAGGSRIVRVSDGRLVTTLRDSIRRSGGEVLAVPVQ